MTTAAQEADELRERDRRELLEAKIDVRVCRLRVFAARTWLALIMGWRLPDAHE